MTDQQRDETTTATSVDGRPRVWLGHLGPLPVTDLGDSIAFYEAAGSRLVTKVRDLAIFELRGGTHLIVQRSDDVEGGPAPFDFMVDDLDVTRADYLSAGLAPTEIVSGSIHRSFTIADPSGNVITINDSHVSGPV